jgi:4-hydroxy-tetrahydrodipicolinate synthase
MANPFDQGHTRRQFLAKLAATAGFLSPFRSHALFAGGSGKKMAGIFPIGFSPFTEDNKLDLEGLAAEVRFCNKGGVHGFVWPQLASVWSSLSDTERMDGAEAILSAGRGGNTALVIGVQAAELSSVKKYAKHAERLGADAIISLPPAGITDPGALLEYYRQVGAATDLPLFAQTTGNMSVDLLIEMFKAIPTFRQVKDEAGNPLERIAEIHKRTSGQLGVFSGFGVRTLMTEMELGFAGHCPFASLADVYSSAYDQFHSGKKREAFDMFGRILAFASMVPLGAIDIMIARGVFKPTTRTRNAPPVPGAGSPSAGVSAQPVPPPLTHDQIHDALQLYLGPYLKT